MAYVAYTDLGAGSGAPVEEENYSPDEWKYMLDHSMVVLQGSPDDPNVLAASAAGEGYTDPRDVKIAELEAQLAALQGGDTSGGEPKEGGKPPEAPVEPLKGPETPPVK